MASKLRIKILTPLEQWGICDVLMAHFLFQNERVLWLVRTTLIATQISAWNTLHTVGSISLVKKLPAMAKLTEKPYTE